MSTSAATQSELYQNAQTLVKNVAIQSNSNESLFMLPYNNYSYCYISKDKNGNFIFENAKLNEYLNNTSYVPSQPSENPSSILYPVPQGLKEPTSWPDANGFPFAGSVELNGESCYFSITDCSGFVSHLIQKTSPTIYQNFAHKITDIQKAISGLAAIDSKHNQPWPSAADYACFGIYLVSKTVDEWLPIAAFDANNDVVSDLSFHNVLAGNGKNGLPQKGDIMAWGGTSGNDTGHVMIIEDVSLLPPPAMLSSSVDTAIKVGNELASTPLIPEGTDKTSEITFKIGVYDSSDVWHNKDSRGTGSNFNPGAGSGNIGFSFSLDSTVKNPWKFGFQEGYVTNQCDYISIFRMNPTS